MSEEDIDRSKSKLISDGSATSEEFEFYFAFTKPLVLDLPSSEDRAIAAAWVQKLETESESVDKLLRLNYLKLLLFVLQRGRLSGIFKKQPPAGPLQPFPQGFSIIDMGNWMLDQDDGQPCGGGDARSVPYTIEISNDLREFVAAQEIPNFGIQMYYAWSSDEPIHKWASFDEEKFPQFILDKIKQLKEVKSDEKPFISKAGCLTKKKGCDLNLQGKSSKKKVKSPQEIERAQGRSFHTYMGLVGRMGNFNDKCNDDPEKFQRADQRKAKCQRNVQKRCPTGEAEDMLEDEHDNLLSGLGGINSQTGSCACPGGGYENGAPQAFDALQPDRNVSVYRGDVENVQCPAGVKSPVQRRVNMENACPDIEMPQQMSQQRCASNSSRSNSPIRSNLECPQEGSSRNCPKPAKQDLCGPEGYGNRPAPPYNPCVKPPDNCPPISPPRSTSYRAAGANMRGGPTEIVHCYDSRNPDPALYEKMDKGWMDAARERVTDYQNCSGREQDTSQMMPLFDSPPRGRFNPVAHSTPMAQEPPGVVSDIPRHAGRYCPPSVRLTSPPYRANPMNDFEAAEGVNPSCPPGLNQHMSSNQHYQQNYVDFDGQGGPAAYGRQKADKYRKTAPQPMDRCPGVPVGNESGRMANMANVLEGMKQRTEAHREKCVSAARRSPVNDAACYSATANKTRSHQEIAFDNEVMVQNPNRQPKATRQQTFYSQQPKPAQQNSPYQDTGYGNFTNSMQIKLTTPQRQPVVDPFNLQCLPTTQPTFQEFQYEDDDCESSESLDAYGENCAPAPQAQDPNCAPQAGSRGNAPVQDNAYGGEACPQNGSGQQWMIMQSVEDERSATSRGFQGEVVDIVGRPCVPESSSRQNSPSNSPSRRSPTRSNSTRCPGKPAGQDSTTEDDTRTAFLKSSWANRTELGYRTQSDCPEAWSSLPGIPMEYLERYQNDSNNLECREMQFTPPVPQRIPGPPSNTPCPQQSMAGPPTNMPCPQQSKAGLSPNRACSTPSKPGPLTNLACPPQNMSAPSPRGACPPQNRTPRSPNRACPPQNMPCPSPSRTGPSPNRADLSPDRACPQQNMACPPQNMSSPPANRTCPQQNRSCPPQNMSGPPPNSSCVPPSQPCQPPNMPCMRQQRTHANYGSQAMNAEVQDDLCDVEIAIDIPDLGLNNLNDMEDCDQEDFTRPTTEEDYDDYDVMNVEDCDPMPPQNMPLTRSPMSRGKSPSRGQRLCNGNQNFL